MVVDDLSGAYNEVGIRQWFERKRPRLEWTYALEAGWNPTQPEPRRVRELARALVGPL